MEEDKTEPKLQTREEKEALIHEAALNSGAKIFELLYSKNDFNMNSEQVKKYEQRFADYEEIKKFARELNKNPVLLPLQEPKIKDK
jgi:hypothetical protein